jgi:hypothetical protein
MKIQLKLRKGNVNKPNQNPKHLVQLKGLKSNLLISRSTIKLEMKRVISNNLIVRISILF